jgi:hypothetical protein
VCVAEGLPSKAELVRLGNSYWAEAAVNTQPLTTLPTQANGCNVYLCNGEPPGGKSYIVDTVAFRYGTSSGVIQVAAVFGHLFGANPFPTSIFVNPPTNNSTIFSLSGKASYAGRGFVHTVGGGDGSPADEGFQHAIVQSPVSANTNTATFTLTKDVYGRYIVPPQGAFGTSPVASFSSLSGTGRIFVLWHEVQLSIGN